MTRALFDSTNIYDIPTTAPMVGYYVDGIYAVSAATVRARFPNAVLVGISAVGTDNGIVGDVEPGCMSPQQAVQWVRYRRLANADPTIYCNETYGWTLVRSAFRAAGVPEPHYWCANYDGVAALRPGEVARQYANPTLTHGHYDLSVVADYWPGVDGQGDQMTPQELAQAKDTNDKVTEVWDLLRQGIHAPQNPRWVYDELEAIKNKSAPTPPAPVIDYGALADAVVARMPKPPVAPQAVKDWWAAVTHWLGLA